MMLGIDPKVDYAFKWLFGNQKNTSILIHLLHAILNPTSEGDLPCLYSVNRFASLSSLLRNSPGM
jgi:hypothetical protein